MDIICHIFNVCFSHARSLLFFFLARTTSLCRSNGCSPFYRIRSALMLISPQSFSSGADTMQLVELMQLQ